MSLTAPESSFFAGVDFGQMNDWTTVSIIERIRAMPDLKNLPEGLHARAKAEAKASPIRLDLVHLDRIPLGTTYPVQVEHIRGLLRAPLLGDVQTYLDATGVGLGPFQMLKAAGVRGLHGITITSSQGPAKRGPHGWNVGKAELVNRVQIEMQTGRLRIGRRVPNADTLVRELKEFRVHTSAAGHQTYNAREGQHDDLVLASSYAVFGALRPVAANSFDLRFVA